MICNASKQPRRIKGYEERGVMRKREGGKGSRFNASWSCFLLPPFAFAFLPPLHIRADTRGTGQDETGLELKSLSLSLS